MGKINFKSLNVETQIDKFEEKDVTKMLGNLIHSQAQTVTADELAHSIYHSEKEIEISREDYQEMMTILKRSGVIYCYLNAIEKAYNEK